MSLSIVRLGVVLDGQALVEDFSLQLQAGTVHAVVGESGAGKTLSALAVLGLLPPGASTRGRVIHDGVELLSSPGKTRRAGLAMVLQESLTALNPVLSVGEQLRETLSVHGASGDHRALALGLLAEVGLPLAADVLRLFPHQLSGGQRQRVAIACALAARPRVLIADEPTSALDASMRGLVLSLLRTLAEVRSLAVWLITHDLFAVRKASDEVSVMYSGRVVEHGPTQRVFEAPRHPYTAALLASNPANARPGAPLPTLIGAAPSAREAISGCRFHPRCPRVFDQCREQSPELVDDVACHLGHQP